MMIPLHLPKVQKKNQKKKAKKKAQMNKQITFILLFWSSWCLGATVFSEDPFVAQSFAMLSSQATSWKGGIIPTVTDDVVIDLSTSMCNSSAYHYFVFDVSASFASLTISASQATGAIICTTRVFVRQDIMINVPKVTLSGGLFASLVFVGGGAAFVGYELNILDSFLITGSGMLNFVTVSSNGGVIMPGGYYSSSPSVFPKCNNAFLGYIDEMPSGLIYGDLLIKGSFSADSSTSVVYGSFGTQSEFVGRFRPGRMVDVTIFDTLDVVSQVYVQQYGTTNTSASMIEWKQLVTSLTSPFALFYITSISDFVGSPTLCPIILVDTANFIVIPPVTCPGTSTDTSSGYAGLSVLLQASGTTCTTVQCPFSCLNGGTCTAAGVCACLSNYTGPSCNQFVAAPTTTNASSTNPPSSASSNNNALVLGLAIGVPLGVAAGVGVAIAAYVTTKHQQAAVMASHLTQMRDIK